MLEIEMLKIKWSGKRCGWNLLGGVVENSTTREKTWLPHFFLYHFTSTCCLCFFFFLRSGPLPPKTCTATPPLRKKWKIKRWRRFTDPNPVIPRHISRSLCLSISLESTTDKPFLCPHALIYRPPLLPTLCVLGGGSFKLPA